VTTLDDFLITTGTTAFIIISNDSILFEKYYNNCTRDSINTSFSISKSFTSALIGCAIDDKYINSDSDLVSDYIPELKSKISDNLAIKHLLSMSSGIKYDARYYPWSDEPKSYYYPDIQSLILRAVRQEYKPGQYFKYVNYNTILLGMILERAKGLNPARYLQDKIWKAIGMEYPASWSTDSKITGFPKMESGINGRSIDYAKFGRLFIKKGTWNGKQVLSDSWISQSTCPPNIENEAYYISKNYYPYSMFFKDRQLFYKYGWWGLRRDESYFDYIALGIFGQFIYLCPKKQIIIVRNGKKWGKVDWWPSIFKSLTDKL
jgi:CubicO group peptidase (beta-lactamase class C family)